MFDIVFLPPSNIIKILNSNKELAIKLDTTMWELKDYIASWAYNTYDFFNDHKDKFLVTTFNKSINEVDALKMVYKNEDEIEITYVKLIGPKFYYDENQEYDVVESSKVEEIIQASIFPIVITMDQLQEWHFGDFYNLLQP